jgi:hypothetical protein
MPWQQLILPSWLRAQAILPSLLWQQSMGLPLASLQFLQPFLQHSVHFALSAQQAHVLASAFAAGAAGAVFWAINARANNIKTTKVSAFFMNSSLFDGNELFSSRARE